MACRTIAARAVTARAITARAIAGGDAMDVRAAARHDWQREG